jgi:protoporphyrinogen IX oxidase
MSTTLTLRPVLSETFKVMEQRLLRIIMNPAMMTVWITGPLLGWMQGVYLEGWFLAKMLLVVAMTVFHVKLSIWRKEFAADANTRPNKYYRMANEFPTVLMAVIVLLVILKPF